VDMTVVYELHLEAAGIPGAAKGFRVISVWQQLKRGWVLISHSATAFS
jgi:hypothetical protein